MFAYEESAAQIIRNMRSIGIDLEPWLKKGLLEIHASRPTLSGLEQHLVSMHDAVLAFRPSVVVTDPVSNLGLENQDITPMLMRLIDFMKTQQITALFTTLTKGGATPAEESEVGVSSLMDAWLLLRNIESNGERNRLLFVLKACGMAHSNQVREFVLGSNGIDLLDVYLGTGSVLTGTARVAQEGLEAAAAALRNQEHARKLRQLATKRSAIEAQIAALRSEAEAEEAEVTFAIAQENLQLDAAARSAKAMERLRTGAGARGSRNGEKKAKR
jgi:circadian clock protein KaiC